MLDSVADDGASDPVNLTLNNEVGVLLLKHGLDELNEREREVLAGRCGLRDRELRDVGGAGRSGIGLTRERIRQIQQWKRRSSSSAGWRAAASTGSRFFERCDRRRCVCTMPSAGPSRVLRNCG